MRWLRHVRRNLPEIILLGAAAALYLADLGGDAMRDWDEATYACAAREMRARGDWSTMILDGQPYFFKPPLVVWLIAVAQSALGDTELAARLPAALFGIAGVAAAYLVARRLGGRLSGLLAGAILAAAPQWLRFSRQAMLDVPLAIALSFAFLGALAGSWPLLGAALGVAAMIKGPAAAIALPPLATWALMDRRRVRSVAYGLALAAALAAPWHVRQLAVHGEAFASAYLGFNVAGRLTSVVEGNTGPWWYYLEYVFFHWVNPWHWLGAAAVVAATAAALRPPRRQDATLVALWFWTVLAAYSLAATKLHWYVMPAYPALAVLTACWLAPATRARRGVALATAAACVATVALAGAEVALHRLRNRPAEATRAVLQALPPAAEAPVLLVELSLPLDTARFYARREVRRWTPGSPLPPDSWVLVTPERLPAPHGHRVAVHSGGRALIAPR